MPQYRYSGFIVTFLTGNFIQKHLSLIIRLTWRLNKLINNDRPNQYVPDENEREYWDWWQDTNSTNEWALRRSNQLLEWVNRLANGKQIRILDSGCGNGWFAVKLAEYGEVTGIDLSEAHMFDAAQKYPHINFFSGDFISYDLPLQHFDIVVSQQVIAHVHNQQGYINRIHDLLVPGGYLALTTNNKFILQRTASYQSHEKRGHRENWLSKKQLFNLLKPGFTLIKHETINPVGSKGILRLSNSHKLNSLLGYFFSSEDIERLKEKIGLGYIHLIIAQKK